MEFENLYLWVRVVLSDDAYVVNCKTYMFNAQPASPNSYMGGVLGELEFDPPASLDNLPEVIANPMRVMLMRGKSLEGVGDWLNSTNMWLSIPDVGVEDFLDIIRRPSWKSANGPPQRFYPEIAQHLHPEKTIKGSDWKILYLDRDPSIY